ncbi:hypothetical protein M378DRAFT_72651 [Amanita muscaria Koide BX008]|uniref:Uncharacterized protein n=1 Tax=Amanita muscaria (strain Koide BX008) TaxID=946122 RepID=A0A0C2X0U7_AMAMK|nr:hypothetical protein M378DRAFT_72651 [Amanita muscaria Koide BX008]
MKFILNTAVAFALVAFVSSLPVHVKRAVDPALVPEFGVQPGDNPTGTGDCDGITNSQEVVKIPCSCPPDRKSFIESLSANVAAGHVINNPSVLVTFPTDNSKASRIVRIQAAVVTLQNLRGPGVGCPAASTTFLAQQKAIASEPDTPSPPAPAPPGPTRSNITPSTSTSGNQVPLVNATLVPDLGHQAGLNPDGHGNCDGITNAQGKVIKVPFACPPNRESFIQARYENVAAGKAVHNPSVAVSFPTDESKDSLATRIEAAIITLQNLRGPGVGCPASSTTLAVSTSVASNPSHLPCTRHS